MASQTTIRRVFMSILSVILMNICAQAGSGYSRFGVGEIRHFPHERSAGMGGAHIGVLGTYTIDAINPAAWTPINRMRFAIGTSYDGYAIEDGSSATFLSAATFNGFTFAVPLSTENGFVLGLGLTPYSAVNYNVNTTVDVPPFPYTLKQEGQGGLSNASLGLSYLLGHHWHVGVKMNYLFGTLHHKTAQLFQSSQLTNVSLDRATQLKGATFTFGTIFSGLKNLFSLSESDAMTVGAIFTTGAGLTTSQENFYEYTSGGGITGRDTVLVAEGSSSLPFMFGLGLSYTSNERFTLATDFSYQKWSTFDFVGNPSPGLRNSYRLSAGGEFLPRRDVTATYWERTSYQFGAFYTATEVNVNGKGIDEYGVTGGMGLPLFGETRLSIAIQYSIRGTIDVEKDNILRVAFTLNAGELWFFRPPEE